MIVVPLHIKQANEFVSKYHRHSDPTVGCKFCIGAEKDGKLVGVAIAGRPVARHADNGTTLEVLRVCTDGTRNANSFLYSRIKRIGQLMGYKRILTYTLPSESQASLKGIGAKLDGVVPIVKNPYGSKNRQRKRKPIYEQQKFRWVL